MDQEFQAELEARILKLEKEQKEASRTGFTKRDYIIWGSVILLCFAAVIGGAFL